MSTSVLCCDYHPKNHKVKLLWFVYLLECVQPDGSFQYVGSTNHITERWANTKSKCNSRNTEGSRMEKHFKNGCPPNSTNSLEKVKIYLLEHFDTTSKKLSNCHHKPGPSCRCQQCEMLKTIEDNWIFRLGTMIGKFGLNSRNKVTNKDRSGY